MKTKFGPNHTIVVTGASAGVGRAIALSFAQRGCKIALIARGKENLANAAREVEEAGGQAFAVTCDVSDAKEVAVATQMIEQALGPVDVWVNNAMVTIYAPVKDLSAEEFEQVTRVTYLGQVFATQSVLKSMRERNEGTIVFINSALGHRSIPFQAPYCAAKAAVRGFVDSLRSELQSEGKNIRLSTIYLPAVNTPQFNWARNKLGRRPAPVPPIFQPEAIGEAVVRAAARGPRELWLGTSTLKAIFGQIVAPAFVDRKLAKSGIGGETEDTADTWIRPDNLFGAGELTARTHGRFDDTAASWITAYNPAWLRASVAGVGAMTLATLGLLAFAAGRSKRP